MFQQFDRIRDRDRDRERNRDRDRNRQDFRRGTPFDIFRFLIPFTPFTPFNPIFPQRPSNGPPSGPPPAFIPQMPPIGAFAVDPRAISNCLFRFTYIWPYQLRPFWFYPTFVGPRSVAGYRCNGFSWNYFGIDLREIQSFQCF